MEAISRTPQVCRMDDRRELLELGHQQHEPLLRLRLISSRRARCRIGGGRRWRWRAERRPGDGLGRSRLRRGRCARSGARHGRCLQAAGASQRSPKWPLAGLWERAWTRVGLCALMTFHLSIQSQPRSLGRCCVNPQTWVICLSTQSAHNLPRGEAGCGDV